MARSTVAVKFTGDTADLKRAMDDTDRRLNGLGGKFTKFGKIAAAGLAGAAAGAVVFGKSAVDAYVDAEEKQAALASAFEKFPALASGNIDALRELNEELAKKTKFDDDATASGQAVLAQFGLTADQIAAITPLMQDYAAKTGKDLPTAATDLGKAVLGQGRALKGIGIEFKDTGDAAGNLEQLMGGLNDKVGGFAEDQGQTAAGKAEILKNQFGELQEEIGSKLVPMLLKLADFVTESLLPALQRVVDQVRENWPEIKRTITDAVQGIVDFVAPVVQIIQTLWENFGDNILSFVERVWPRIQQMIGGVITTIRGIIQTILALIQGDWSGVWEGIKTTVGGIWEAIQGIIGSALEQIQLLLGIWMETVGGAFRGFWDGIVEFLGGLPEKLGAAARLAWEALQDGLEAAIDWILEQIDRMLGPLDEALGKLDGVKEFFGGGLDIEGLRARAGGPPRFDNGGVMPGPLGKHNLAWVAGGETILPTHRTGGGGDTITINVVAGNEGAGVAVAREMRRREMLIGRR